MFELEGTKHEKSVLVVLAYIIGLTSGYIGFGVTASYNNSYDKSNFSAAVVQSTVATDREGEPASSASAVAAPVVEAPVVEDNMSFVYYEDNRLTVNGPEGRLLLTIHSDEVDGDMGADFATQGVHVAPPVFAANDAENNVFFCEFSTTDTACLAYVYNVFENVIYPVTVAGEHLELTRSEAASVAWESNVLTLANFTSSATSPWELVIQ